jgi:hypothetical protein
MYFFFYIKEGVLREMRNEIQVLVGNPQGRDKGMSLNKEIVM